MTDAVRLRTFVAAIVGAGLIMLGGCLREAGDPNDPNDGNEPNAAASNRAPEARVGDDMTVVAGQEVALNGAETSDPDGDRLVFIWRQVSGTPTVELQNAAGSTARFFAPIVSSSTTLRFRLTVADGLSSTTAEVSVTIEPG